MEEKQLSNPLTKLKSQEIREPDINRQTFGQQTTGKKFISEHMLEESFDRIDTMPFAITKSKSKTKDQFHDSTTKKEIQEAMKPTITGQQSNSFKNLLLSSADSLKSTHYERLQYISMLKQIQPLENYCKIKYLNLRGRERKMLVKEIEDIIIKLRFQI